MRQLQQLSPRKPIHVSPMPGSTPALLAAAAAAAAAKGTNNNNKSNNNGAAGPSSAAFLSSSSSLPYMTPPRHGTLKGAASALSSLSRPSTSSRLFGTIIEEPTPHL